MECNPEKCEVVYFGRTNKAGIYIINTQNGKIPGGSGEQRDLGVSVLKAFLIRDYKSWIFEGHSTDR